MRRRQSKYLACDWLASNGWRQGSRRSNEKEACRGRPSSAVLTIVGGPGGWVRDKHSEHTHTTCSQATLQRVRGHRHGWSKQETAWEVWRGAAQHTHTQHVCGVRQGHKGRHGGRSWSRSCASGVQQFAQHRATQHGSQCMELVRGCVKRRQVICHVQSRLGTSERPRGPHLCGSGHTCLVQAHATPH